MMMALNVEIIDEAAVDDTPAPADFQRWAEVAVLNDSITSEVTITLVDKDKSAALNQQYRQKSGPTNVLAFEYPQMPGIDNETLGDLIICSEVVTEEAAQQHKALDAHFAHLTIHGMLHLQGYDHHIEDEAIKMEQLETKLMQQLGFQDPYQDL